MEWLEKIIDEIIAFLVVVSTIMFIAWNVSVPDWWATSFGMVIAFYFSKKAMTNRRREENEEVNNRESK